MERNLLPRTLEQGA